MNNGTKQYIKASLRLISWVSKDTGEENSCYAFTTSGANSAQVFGQKQATSLTARLAGKRINNASSDLTIWMNDLTEEEYQLYKEQGNLNAYIWIEGDITSPDSYGVISTQEYNQLDTPETIHAFA